MIKDHVAEALEMFESGCNCSQSVLGAFCEELGLSKETAFKLACPFGGGLGGYGNICGALTGAMMVVGLKYGATGGNDLDAKRFSNEKTRQLIEDFNKKHGSCNCNDLIGFDRSNLSAAELMEKNPIFHSACPKFLETVIVFLEEEL